MSQFISKPVEREGVSEGLRYFIKYIERRITNDRNFMCAFIGSTGSGKSFATLSIMELLYPKKSKQEIVDNVFFSPRPFMEAVTKENVKVGDGFSFDESGVSQNSKNWQSLINRMINYILQTFRYKRLVIFFCLPHFSFLDSDTRKLVHAVFETHKIDRERNVLQVKPLFLQTNHRTGKVYFKYLRIKKGNSLVPIKIIEIPKPSDELIELYQKKKKEFAQQLYEDILIRLEKQEKKSNPPSRTIDILTPKQVQVLKAYQENGTQIAASKALGLALGNVNVSLVSIRRKLGLSSPEDLKKVAVPV